MKEETITSISYKSNGQRVETIRKGVIIWDSFGNPAFFVNDKEGFVMEGDSKLWDPITPTGCHTWLEENKKEIVYESSTQTWKIKKSSKPM